MFVVGVCVMVFMCNVEKVRELLVEGMEVIFGDFVMWDWYD